MRTRIDEIAERIYRISTFVPEAAGPQGFTYNQFLLDAKEPLLFHTGMRGIFGAVSAAVETVRPLRTLRWIAFGHVEADECGAANEFLASCPHARVTSGTLACRLSLDDLCDRTPRPLADGEVLDIGDQQLRRRVRQINTPHVPHNWEAQVMFEEQTRTLLCGDLFTQLGDSEPVVEDDLIERSLVAERTSRPTSNPWAAATTMRSLAELAPATLAAMHGASFSGDGASALRGLAEAYDDLAETLS